MVMKLITWLGNSYKVVKSFPKDAKHEAGYNLERVQHSLLPRDVKPIKGVGKGIQEIRIHLANEYRIFYVAKFKEAIYVLHAT